MVTKKRKGEERRGRYSVMWLWKPLSVCLTCIFLYNRCRNTRETEDRTTITNAIKPRRLNIRTNIHYIHTLYKSIITSIIIIIKAPGGSIVIHLFWVSQLVNTEALGLWIGSAVFWKLSVSDEFGTRHKNQLFFNSSVIRLSTVILTELKLLDLQVKFTENKTHWDLFYSTRSSTVFH